MSVDILRCIYTQYSIREWTPVMVSRVAPYRPAFWKMEKYCPGLKVPVSQIGTKRTEFNTKRKLADQKNSAFEAE